MIRFMPAKLRANDAHAKMRFAGAAEGGMMLGIMVVMTGMEMAFVDDDKPPLGRESARRFFSIHPVWTSTRLLPYGSAFRDMAACRGNFHRGTSLPQSAQNRA